MQRRLVNHLAAGGTTDMCSSSMAVDVRIYTDPERLAAERKEMFLKLPALAGLSCDIPQPGDVIVFDALGPSILVVRGKDGKVRAFLNSCRHRAVKLVHECGHARRLTCPFHGWTYDLEGKLVGLPGREAFGDIDQTKMNLVRVPVAEWCGLIFVKTSPGEEKIDVEGFLGDLAPELRQLDLANLRPVIKKVVNVDANWKFTLDTFFESYHFQTLHSKSLAAQSFGNVLIHDAFGPHQRIMIPARFFADWVGRPEDKWDFSPYQGLHLIFPNSMLYVGNLDATEAGANPNPERQAFGVWRAFPGDSPAKSFTMMATYAHASQVGDTAQREYQEWSNFVTHVVETEDYSLCRDGQKNLETSPPGHTIVFGRNELSLQSIHRHINALVGPSGR
jgi:phenylpropionate dioxygenase-like ring-hydroxylating dioxygenase large terminal subunit